MNAHMKRQIANLPDYVLSTYSARADRADLTKEIKTRAATLYAHTIHFFETDADEHVDPMTDELNLTALVESCVWFSDLFDSGAYDPISGVDVLDEPEHWVWLAVVDFDDGRLIFEDDDYATR